MFKLIPFIIWFTFSFKNEMKLYYLNLHRKYFSVNILSMKLTFDKHFITSWPGQVLFDFKETEVKINQKLKYICPIYFVDSLQLHQIKIHYIIHIGLYIFRQSKIEKYLASYPGHVQKNIL